MKTRIIQTKFWADEFISSLSLQEKLLYIYYLTNEKVNIIHCYECPNKYVSADTGVSIKILEKFQEKLQKNNKILFYRGYVYLLNSWKYEQYKGEDNEKAKEKLLKEMSSDVLDWYNKKLYTSVERGDDGGVATPTINHKSVISNNNIGVVKGEEEWEELKKKYPNLKIETEFEKADDWLKSTGKIYKDYNAFFRNWLRRANNYLSTNKRKETFYEV